MPYQKGMFKGKKITLMGLGLLGRGVGDADFFAREGAELIITDLKNKKELKASLERLKKYKNIQYVLGEHRVEDFENRDFIIKAAGVPLGSSFIEHARKNNISVFMSTALFASLTPAKIVGITGTRGKTTVTFMIRHVLKKTYKRGKVFLGGNIQGMSTLSLLPKVKKGDIVVLELDSWQLQGFRDLKISPDISVFTTFMPDHLNYYKNDLELYFKDKLSIFAYTKNTRTIFAGEQLCSLPSHFTKMLPRQTKFISEKVLSKSLKLKIPGGHNRYNAALAYAALRSLKVPASSIEKALSTFLGVPHRLQKILLYKGITVYNDTTATTPAALIAALEALGKNKNIILIAGGSDKNIGFEGLQGSLIQHTKALLLLKGSGTDRLIKEGVIEGLSYTVFSSLERAVREAFKRATPGDVLLLSPGFASFGMFQNEYDRGEQFAHLVMKMRK